MQTLSPSTKVPFATDLQEPSMVALTIEDERIVAIGQEARDMFGRHPEHIEVVRPLQNGVIADYEVTEAMLRHFFQKVSSRIRLFGGPQCVISVPYGVTSVEKRAVHEAAIQAGARLMGGGNGIIHGLYAFSRKAK